MMDDNDDDNDVVVEPTLSTIVETAQKTDVLSSLVAALTKAELAEHLHTELGVSKREAKTLVEAFFEEIRGCLRENEQVKLSGFGNFDLRDKRERPGRNPKTGEEIPISARRVVTFRPGQKLKARVEAFDGPAPQ